MDEFVSKKLLVAKFNELASKYTDGYKRQRGLAYATAADMIAIIDAADVQPLSVVAEHIKKRLYETAFDTNELIAREAITDMAERIDFWIDELKEGEHND